MSDQFIQPFIDFKDLVIQNLPSVLIGIIFLVVFIFLGVFFRSVARKRLQKRISDRLLTNFIGRAIFLFMLVFGVVIFLNQIGLGKAAGGLLAGAGVSAIILGFAFKDIGENFLAGFFLAFSRPFSIGDVIEVEALRGRVKALNFRNTHIRTFEGKDIFVPNAMLIKNPLINYTRDGLLRYDFTVGLDYGDDILKASRLMIEILEKEPRIEHNEELKPFVLLKEFGTSTVNIQIFYWVNAINFTSQIAVLQTEIMNKVVTELLREGYSLPADIVELKIYQEGQPIPLQIKPNADSEGIRNELSK